MCKEAHFTSNKLCRYINFKRVHALIFFVQCAKFFVHNVPNGTMWLRTKCDVNLWAARTHLCKQGVGHFYEEMCRYINFFRVRAISEFLVFSRSCFFLAQCSCLPGCFAQNDDVCLFVCTYVSHFYEENVQVH